MIRQSGLLENRNATGHPVLGVELESFIADLAAGSLNDTQAAAAVLERFPNVHSIELAAAAIGLVRDWGHRRHG